VAPLLEAWQASQENDVRLYYEEYIKTEKFKYILNAVDPTNLSQVDPTAIFSF
jgi:hypothetical protein